jgi:hypothetical protein
MDPLEQIKQILVEEENKKGMEQAEPVNGKAMQMKNVETTRAQDTASKMPSQNAEVILKGPGVDMIQSLLAKIPTATAPEKDPKAKSSSQKMSFGMTDTFGNAKAAPVANNSNEAEEAEEGDEGEEKEMGKKEEEYEGDENMPMLKEKKPMMKSEKMEEHLSALFNGETLSEDFKQKAALIFQTALEDREQSLREEIANEYEALAEEYVEVIKTQMNEQVDSYLGYVVNEWVEENRLQLENGVRLEIAESFIEGLRTLFVEHGVDVPDSDVNLVEQLSGKIDELESRLNEEINRNIDLNESIESYRRNEVIATLGEELTSAEFDRFMKLCESVSYDTDENFINKINTIKESYFGENTTTAAAPVNYLTESVEDVASSNDVVELNESMDQYVQTLARFGKK